MWTPSTSYLHGREDEWAKKKKKILNISKAQIFDTDNFYHSGPPENWHFQRAWFYLVFFHLWRKKMMFQVMLFSMLHYPISQSGNSIFVHKRILSCLIVYFSLLPPICCSFHFPLCCLPVDSLVCDNHGDGSLLDSVCSGLEVKDQSGPHQPRNAGRWKVRGLWTWREGLSRDRVFLMCLKIPWRKPMAEERGPWNCWGRALGPGLHFLAERPGAGHLTSLTLSRLFYQLAACRLASHPVITTFKTY